MKDEHEELIAHRIKYDIQYVFLDISTKPILNIRMRWLFASVRSLEKSFQNSNNHF